ncbi:MAG: hypothetical protein V1845_00825 [bacterium]
MDRNTFKLCVVFLILTAFSPQIKVGIQIGTDVLGELSYGAYSALRQKAMDFRQQQFERKIRKEGSIEWYLEQSKLIIKFRDYIGRESRAIQDGKKDLRLNSKLTKYEIMRIFVEQECKLRETQRLYNGLLNDFNAAIMRYSHGLQYRGAENGLL